MQAAFECLEGMERDEGEFGEEKREDGEGDPADREAASGSGCDGGGQGSVEQEEQYVETLRGKVKKIKAWLRENDDKPGKSGKPVKSNITDNESAKMKTSHGVIQGYDGVAVVDGKHQVIVHAEAFGAAQEHDLLIPMIEGTRENFEAIGKKQDVFKEAKLTADSGFHTEANMKEVMEQGIDAYIADTQFRKRDPRFSEVDKYKERFRKRGRSTTGWPTYTGRTGTLR